MTINPMSYGEYIVSQAFRKDAAEDKQMIIILPHETEELIGYLDQNHNRAAQEAQFINQAEKAIEKALPRVLDKALNGMRNGKIINIEVKL